MIPNLPPPGRKRKSRPMRIELRAALRAAGLDPDQPIEYDHVPPLAQRPWNEELQDFEPAENDDRYLVPRQKAVHREKTAKEDAPAIAKTRRQAKGELRHLAAIAEKGSGIDEALAHVRGRKRGWPKRKMRSRGFQKRS